MILTTAERRTLEKWVRPRTTAQRIVLRNRIVLLVGEGVAQREVARQLGISRHAVGLWRRRFLEGGCGALTYDRPGRGRKQRPRLSDAARHTQASSDISQRLEVFE